MNDIVVLGGDWAGDLVIDGDCSLGIIQDGSAVQVIQVRGGYPVYSGPTVFTPGTQDQTVSAAGFVFASDITVEKIPSNWGLITWNGSVLTVS